jgi:hypothetical protein
MNFIQITLQALEVGKAQVLARLIPLAAALFFVCGAYDMLIYHGLSDAQSMDNAQIARQIIRHQGFTTMFLRPQAVAQLRDRAMSQSVQGKPGELFPADRYPSGIQRILPDTYNAPGYPCVLAAWFFFTRPEFGQTPTAMFGTHIYSPDRFIPILNQIFMLLTACLVFALGRRLFDHRVAWMSLVAFLGTDLVWHYTLTALSTSFLMFLVTGASLCALEVYCVSEACFENDDRSFTPAWVWGFAVAFLLAAACLTRLHLLVLLIPLFFLLIAMPRASFLLFAVIALVVLGCVAPWFLRENAVSGNPLGSNFPLFLSGVGDYAGNQIYCATSIASYDPLFKDASKKEMSGFFWHLTHAWTMLGTNPLILLFVVSFLHPFKRRRTRMFHWLLFGCSFALITVNNLGSAAPEDVGPWNVLVLFYPGMLVIGSAYFFVLLDRLNLQVKLLSTMIVFTTMALGLVPMVLSLTTTSYFYYAYPPYMPPLIKQFGQLSKPDEWLASDMPWATAWYADRPSLWLPDSISDFENLNDNTCPIGLLFLTPVTTAQPLSNYTTGEYKDWFPLIARQPTPPGFPLSVHSATPNGGPEYNVWSDRARWGER